MKIFNNKSISVLVASALPAAFGFLAIPIIIRNIGAENFGVFSLAVALLGFSSALDLGMSRLLSASNSKAKLESSSFDHTSNNFSFALTLVLLVAGVISILAAIVLWYFSTDLFAWTPDKYLHLREPLLWIILSVPVLALTGTVRGGLEGLDQLKLANKVLVFSSSISFVVPLFCSFFSPNVGIAFFILFIVRLFFLIYLVKLVSKIVNLRFQLGAHDKIGHDSIWITISAVLSPTLLYSDRFFMSSYFTLTQIAYYCTPVDLSLRILLVPQALSRVMLPQFASQVKNLKALSSSAEKRIESMFMICFPALLILTGFSHPILKLWLGSEMANQSYVILSICAMGLYFNCLTWITINIYQGIGFFKQLTLLQVIISVVYLVALFFVFNKGLIFLAWLWACRFVGDAFITALYLGFKQQFLRPYLRKLLMYFAFGFLVWIPYFFFQMSDIQQFVYTAFLLIMVGLKFRKIILSSIL